MVGDERTAGPVADRPRDAQRAGHPDRLDEARRRQPVGDGDDRGDAGLPSAPTAADGPARLRQLGRRGWWQVARRTVGQVGEDSLTVWAAALTYYAVLSIFPGLLVMVTALRLTGRRNTETVLRNVEAIAPGPARTILTRALADLQNGQQSTAGLIAIVGLVGALWSASGYVGSFMQAANAIFDVPEGRPLWKKFPIRLGLTILAGVIVSAAALTVVFTGTLARQVGGLIGVGAGAVRLWDVVKWPVLAVLVGVLFAVLYWAAPNARQGGFRWISPGSVLAVLAWLVASAGFALYVTHFGSYNKTYGSLAAVIVFLVWLWISNLAILVGAEFDAELQRQRAIRAGHRADDEPYLPLRDDRKVDTDSSPDL